MLSAEAQEYRQNVGLFATGVAVISCTDPEVDISDFDYTVHGATVNSFTSVSLNPPTVMVSLNAGRAHEFISNHHHFGASVLTEAQQNVSNHFAGKRDPDLTPQFVVRHRVSTLVDCLAWFECEVTLRMEVADHTIFVARVLKCGGNQGSPLMFFGSKYHTPNLAGAKV
jgi:styrene monooxygenase reductase component